MDFQHAERSRGLQEHVRQFTRRHVEPVEDLYYEQVKPEVPLQDASCLTRIEGVGARAGLVESVPVRRAWRPYQSRICASRRKSSGACFGRLKSSRRRIPAHRGPMALRHTRAARSLARPLMEGQIRPAFSMIHLPHTTNFEVFRTY